MPVTAMPQNVHSGCSMQARHLPSDLITLSLHAGLRDISNFSVTATLQNAQRIVSKIPETAANEEDIAPLLEEFEQLTAQLQAELDQLSAVTTNVSPAKL